MMFREELRLEVKEKLWISWKSLHKAQEQCRSSTTYAMDCWCIEPQGKKCFLVKESNQSASILITTTVENVKDSIVYSDSQHGHKMKDVGFKYLKVNRKYNFVDLSSSIHTQNMEWMWGSSKWHYKKQGTEHHHV
jgi:hypothetical protein